MTASTADGSIAAVSAGREDAPAAPRRALFYLAFTEAWERFSYYGMSAILVLYMNQALFLPGRIEGIAGFAEFRHILETVFGPLSTLALASQVYGLYAGFIYFTPVLGGILADRLIGRKRAVLLGAVLMSGGHIAMAFDRTFLVALALLILGCGLLKGNISAQVGAIYARGDAAGRAHGFAIFSMAINAGAILGPVLVAWLADRYGWHRGFAAAGALMLLGLATYLAGYRVLPADPPPVRSDIGAQPGDARIVFALAAVMAISVFQSVAYLQNGNIGLVWIAAHVDLVIGGFRVPVGWFSALDPLASIAFVPILFAWWRAHPTSEITRMAQGAALAALANLVLALASWRGGQVPVVYPVVYELLLGVAFLHYWPTLLALVSRAAPPRINATMLGCVFLSLFVAGLAIGMLGSVYEQMLPAAFWTLNAAIGAIGSLAALTLRGRLTDALSPNDEINRGEAR